MSKSPTDTKLNLKYSVKERANSRTFDPGGPIMKIFFSIIYIIYGLHSGSDSFLIKNSIGSSGFLIMRALSISSKIGYTLFSSRYFSTSCW